MGSCEHGIRILKPVFIMLFSTDCSELQNFSSCLVTFSHTFLILNIHYLLSCRCYVRL